MRSRALEAESEINKNQTYGTWKETKVKHRNENHFLELRPEVTLMAEVTSTSINQPMNQSIKRSTNQSIKLVTDSYGHLERGSYF
jgi:hypothetical protein